MSYRRWIGLLSALVMFACVAPSLSFAQQSYTLEEQLNLNFGRELVHFAAPKGATNRTMQLQGPAGAVAGQLVEHDGQPALAFIAAPLEPLTSATYTPAPGQPPATDLVVNQSNSHAQITTSHVGLRWVLADQSFADAQPMDKVPGPAQAFRLGGDSAKWQGGSQLQGDGRVSHFASEIVAAGPVLAIARATYTFDDGTTLAVQARVAEGDNAIRWSIDVTGGDAPQRSLVLTLPPVPNVSKAYLPKGAGQWARKDRNMALDPSSGEPFAKLTPETRLTNIFADHPDRIIFKPDGDDATAPRLYLASRRPGDWVEPQAPQTYGGYPQWSLHIIGQSWQNWQRKQVPVTYQSDSSVRMDITLASGRRFFTSAAGEQPLVGDRLDAIKEMVLDWPEDKTDPHPRMVFTMDEIRAIWAAMESEPYWEQNLVGGRSAGQVLAILRKPEAERKPAETERVVNYLRNSLAKFGDYDTMRHGIAMAALYDAVRGSDFLTDEDRKLFRAQMAYFAYYMASPEVWSIERGYHSGNPNMSVSYTNTVGVVACVLRDHPMAEQWAQYVTKWQDKWLRDEVGPNGEWVSEGSHYSIVSLEPLITYAITAKRAGFADFTNDERLKRLLLWHAKYHTPPDPQRGNLRVSGSWGRGTSGDKLAIFGQAAKMTADVDPQFSSHMQWMWLQMGKPNFVGDQRLGGYTPYYTDPRLPAQQPDWGSELFPNLGVLMRHAFATPHESYLNVLSNVDSETNLDVWVAGILGIQQWYALGKPVSGAFVQDTGYHVRHTLLRDGVRLGHPWTNDNAATIPFGQYTEVDFGSFVALPTSDYVRTRSTNTRDDDRDWFAKIDPPKFPKEQLADDNTLDWTRQLLFVKDHVADGPAWILLRDTTRGGNPTVWQFWSISEKIGTPEQFADRAAFLADAPGKNKTDASALPQSNRYTAAGQFGVDLEYLIASPTDTPRHTLRYGGNDYKRVPQWEDLLHLQQPGDGSYYVAIFPRAADESAPAPAPEMTALADGRVVRIKHDRGTDYAYLAHSDATARADHATFRGSAGAIQLRDNGQRITLSLTAPGRIDWQGLGFTSAQPASLTADGAMLTLTLPLNDQPASRNHAATEGEANEFSITVPAAGKLSLKAPANGVELHASMGHYRLIVPANVREVVLQR